MGESAKREERDNGSGRTRGGSESSSPRNGISQGRSTPEPADLLPLTEPVYHILLSLSDSERHGYGIILDVEDATSGALRLRTGTLYTAIRRLLREGLIEEIDPEGQAGSDDRRRVYRLTPWGRRVARAESRRIASLTRLARRKGLLKKSARQRF